MGAHKSDAGADDASMGYGITVLDNVYKSRLMFLAFTVFSYEWLVLHHTHPKYMTHHRAGAEI